VIDRRRFGRLTTAMLVALGSQSHSLALFDPQIPSGIGTEPDYSGPLPGGGVLGEEQALSEEQKTAREVLAKAPSGPTPFIVASYFLAVGSGEYGESWKPYISGWPQRWNPVIVSFFKSTDTKPEGDLTPWCAAFVNWCFQQSSGHPATRSASSGSFRCFGAQTTTPRTGDIVVFRRPGGNESCIGHGHVGFFVADHGNEVELLGGNQIEGHPRCHTISTMRLRKTGTFLILHSYRTDARLHDQ